MSKVAITGNASGSGTFTLAAPNSNSDRTLTLPDNTGTIITTGSTFAGTGPAFSVYSSTSQSLSSATFTKITFDTEEWDTNNNFASSRFTPTVAGYYQINGAISNNTGTQTVAYIYKNNSAYKQGTNGSSFAATVSAMVYLNGSTDYVEFFGYFATGTTTNGGVNLTYFQGALVRAA